MWIKPGSRRDAILVLCGLKELEMLARAGLVALDEHRIIVTPKERMLVRNVCMVFDPFLREAPVLKKFSRVI